MLINTANQRKWKSMQCLDQLDLCGWYRVGLTGLLTVNSELICRSYLLMHYLPRLITGITPHCTPDPADCEWQLKRSVFRVNSWSWMSSCSDRTLWEEEEAPRGPRASLEEPWPGNAWGSPLDELEELCVEKEVSLSTAHPQVNRRNQNLDTQTTLQM